MVHTTKQTQATVYVYVYGVWCPCVNTPRSSFNKARKGYSPLLSSIIRSRDDKGTLSKKSEHAEEDFEGFDHKQLDTEFRLSFRSVTFCPVISFCTSCFEGCWGFFLLTFTFICPIILFYILLFFGPSAFQ